jgi:hypothetical protein
MRLLAYTADGDYPCSPSRTFARLTGKCRWLEKDVRAVQEDMVVDHDQSMALALAALVAVFSSMLVSVVPEMSPNAAALLSTVGDEVRAFVSPKVWPQIVERMAAQGARYHDPATESAAPRDH